MNVKKLVIPNIWVYYACEDNSLRKFDPKKCGKWMFFFSDKKFAAEKCKEAVSSGVVYEAKHSDAEEGVACFYLNCDDLAGHKRVLSYFLKNDLIRKTKSGRLYNISFKRNTQTSDGEYGKEFSSEIRLEQFIDLQTRKWKV